MKKIILHITWVGLLSFALLLASCTKDRRIGGKNALSGQPVEMRLQVKSALDGGSISNETAINHLRMVIFGSIGAYDAGKLILNKYYATAPTESILKEIITSGKRDIYIIVNEPLSEGGLELDSYKKIASVADVRNLSLAYQGAGLTTIYNPSEICMFKAHLNKEIAVDNLNNIAGNVERTMAKVSVKLNINSANFVPDKYVIIDTVSIKNLPKSSYLIAKGYVGDLVTSEKQLATSVTPESPYTFSSSNTFYVPEYILNNPDNGAYIEIAGHINNEPNTGNKWKVQLGDAMDKDQTYGDRYNITRNLHYDFTGDIKTYGAMDEWSVQVTVSPWNVIVMDDKPTGQFVSFDRAEGNGGVIADGSTIEESGINLDVYCNTNIGGWYIIVHNAKGQMISKSSTTAEALWEQSQYISINIPALAPTTLSNGYTISIYQPMIAKEEIGPAKSLRLFQRVAGVILRDTLEAAGWPEDKLPTQGLQLAVRGNNKLPGSAAESEDPYIIWKSGQTATAGTTEKGLGMGTSNTALMTGDTHPAAQYCRNMGPGWYLPSFDELMLIANTKLLGAAYTLYSGDYYWSSTSIEGDPTHGDTQSLYVYYSNIGIITGMAPKDSKRMVRCVKNR